jgi:D-hydroxyproline dehydrogenase subunit gamma
MPEFLHILVNGGPVRVSPDTSVAAAVLEGGVNSFHRSVSGQPRASLCGMGICFECGLTIDGELHARSCQII